MLVRPRILVLSALLAVSAPAWSGSSVAVARAAEDPPLEQVAVARPIPGPVVPPEGYRAALDKGTRTPSGAPGASYWQVYSSYQIDAKLEPRTAMVSATETVRFENRSPEELRRIVLYLYQNIHRAGTVRNDPAEITDGVTLQHVAVNDQELFEVPPPPRRRPGANAQSQEHAQPRPGYYAPDTRMIVTLPQPLPAGQAVKLQLSWSFQVPERGMGRMGQNDHEVYFVGYWFPKIAVYDDLRGWDADPYLGAAEFYDSFADYDVSLTVPVGWTVMATGELTNTAEVFSPQTLQRLQQAAAGGDPVQVASAEDRKQGSVTTQPASGVLTYRFRAQRVRDFTWTASNTQVWNATVAKVPDRDGDGAEDRVMIHSFYRPDRAPLWADQVRYAKHAIEFHSRTTGLIYPWPHMTSVEGDGMIGGGMEFPMMTLIGPYRGREARNLYGVTVHELGHMWTPMMLASNEKRYAWMDEGFASYLANLGVRDFFPDAEEDPEDASRETYIGFANRGLEEIMMRHGDHYDTGYGVASYAKPATLLVTLRNLLGRERFEQALHAYFQEWAFKHPTPWDLFSTFERFAGADLDWFWSSWFYTTWQLDQAVGTVTNGPDGARVQIRDLGFVPMPAHVQIDTSAAGTIVRDIPVSHWLTGATSFEIALPASAGQVTAVRIDPDELFPDANRDNNVWPAPEQEAGTGGAEAPGLSPGR